MSGKELRESMTPWVEKYRPKTLDDVIYQNEVVSVLKRCIEMKNISNCLFYGPPGTGKTSTIGAVAKQLFGAEYNKRVLELNASDERGIKVIREKVKKFSKICINLNDSNSELPRFKLIILDEADSMTSTAQAALRRIMEKEVLTTRFCIVCNYISRIIAPLASRCAKFRFKPLPLSVILSHLRAISERENLRVSNEALNMVFECSNGDMRKAIMILHTGKLFFSNGRISADNVADMYSIVPEHILQNLLEASKRKPQDLLELIQKYSNEGYSAQQLFTKITEWALETETLSDLSKAKLLDKISAAEANLNVGADEYLQICSVFSVIIEVIKRPQETSSIY